MECPHFVQCYRESYCAQCLRHIQLCIKKIMSKGQDIDKNVSQKKKEFETYSIKKFL